MDDAQSPPIIEIEAIRYVPGHGNEGLYSKEDDKIMVTVERHEGPQGQDAQKQTHTVQGVLNDFYGVLCDLYTLSRDQTLLLRGVAQKLTHDDEAKTSLGQAFDDVSNQRLEKIEATLSKYQSDRDA